MSHILKTIDLFAGIGGIRLGFQQYGCINVFSSEYDPDAQKMYLENFGEQPHGDITQIDPHNIPEHDILLAGFPCQPFSIIGNKQGFADTRGNLFFNIEEILRNKKPYAFLLENVKQLKTHDNGNTFRIIQEKLCALGYFIHHSILNALDFGLPQKRERIFIVGFKENIQFDFPTPLHKRKSLAEILENDDCVDSKLFASEHIAQKRQDKLKIPAFYPSIWHENKGGNISVLPYSCALRAGGSYNYLLVNGYRRPSSREMLRLQGFPDDFKIVVSYTALRRLTGNSVAVPVISAIAHQMLNAIQHKKLPSYHQQLLFGNM